MPGAMVMALLPTIKGWSKNFTRTCSGNIFLDALPNALPAYNQCRPARRHTPVSCPDVAGSDTKDGLGYHGYGLK